MYILPLFGVDGFWCRWPKDCICRFVGFIMEFFEVIIKIPQVLRLCLKLLKKERENERKKKRK